MGLRVLVACEYSGRVRDAFIKRGHDAISCDLLPTDQPGPHLSGRSIRYSRSGLGSRYSAPALHLVVRKWKPPLCRDTGEA